MGWMLPGNCSPLCRVELPTLITSTRGKACCFFTRLAATTARRF